MQVNLRKQINKDVQNIILKFEKIGWKQVDENIIEKRISGEKFTLTLYPKLLTYTDTEKTTNKKWELFTTSWVACKASTTPLGNYLADMKSLKDEVSKLTIKPFRDEDATHGMFSYPKANAMGWNEYEFYLNPSYKIGYWENHTL